MGERQVTDSSWIPKTPGQSARVEQQSICQEKPSVPYWLNAGVNSQTAQAEIGNCSHLGNSVCFQREIQSKNVGDLPVHVSFDNPGVGAAANSSGIRNPSSFYLDLWNKELLQRTDDAAACTSASISHVQRASSRAESSDSSSTTKGLIHESVMQSAFETYQLKGAELNAGTFQQPLPLTPNLTNTVNNANGSDKQNYWVGEAAKENVDNTVNKIPTVLRELLKEGQSELFVDMSCSNVSKTSLENQEPDLDSSQNVDLKTPQQRSRKKKHRPKVDVEDKSKRKPRSTTPACSEKTSIPKRKYVRRNKANTEGETPTEGRIQSDPVSEAKTTPKRKYTRKKGGNEPTMTPPKECDNGTSSPDTNKEGDNGTSSPKTNQEGDNGTTSPKTKQAARKSCRRSLKFDSDCQIVGESSSCQNVSDLGCKSTSQISLGENQASRKVDIIVERTETRVTQDLVLSPEREFEEYLLTKGVKTVSSSTPPKFDKLDSKLMAGSPDECSTGRCQIVFSDATHDKQASILEFKTQKERVAKIPPSTSNCSSILTQERYGRRGTKRERSSSADLSDSCGIKSAGVQHNCFQEFSEIPQSKVRQEEFSHVSEIVKKKKSVQVHKSTISTMLPTLTPADYRAQNHADAYGYVNKCRQTCCSGTMQLNFSTDSGPSRISAVHTAQLEQASYEYIQTMGNAGQRTKGKSKGRAHYLLSCSPPSKTLKSIPSVDAIIEQFNRLDLEAESSGSVSLEKNAMFAYPWENALVVYHRDQTMIPLDALSNRIKKRPPRPKVNLDEETARVWCLLLENINSEGIDGTDDEKRKYWQQERKIFRGRINSFIAKMRLVQGDRRFRPWKGSVLDSIIGVFLTQNVSDHLSSSAFMSMAARFPLKPGSDHSSAWEGIGEMHDPSHLEENTFGKFSGALQATNDRNYQDLVRNLSEVTESIGTVRSPASDSSECGPSTFSEVKNSEFDTLNGEALMFDGDLRASDDILSSQASVISSQNSTASFGQTSNKKESCPLSFLEESTSDYSQRLSFLELLQMQEQKVYNPGNRKESPLMETVTKSGISESHTERYADHRGFSPSPNIRFSESFKDIEHLATDLSGLSEESAAGPSSQNSTDICFEQHMISMENSAVYSRVAGDQQTKLGSTIQYNASFSSEAILDPWGRTTVKVETNSVERKVEDTVTPKPKNGKNAKEPLPEVDWDMYRKQAESKGKKERTANTMDSVDWEAVRCTEVGEIAETIKERGMNNRLAQRIKDFLNRLIRDHGSIDLEWLRDIPPDKAKEYLLSVRGLGLKSVECVRLLTLHQLAFPVDTNVGRIAVRLGWVPLQPLPESLQLHLLELYPVLESIQKHLWPRLCKLDQRKLYELHYHMITFGKVFCTKSKPNCNSCPMRGECRHFASAYASARLALPAPPDKSIVTAPEQRAACGNPAEKLDHLQLPRPESTENFGAASVLTCSQHIFSVTTTSKPIIEEPTTPQPIIEEPKTPESEPVIEEPQMSESETDEAVPDLTECPVDIEDYMQNDDDEIPTIDLNIEALNQNLQNIIQNSVALQNSEYSKSLVVLTPEAASIPMPKLKNINRLRTEHQVYVLPDSHQLLKGVEKREEKDQCPYLLAIWAPGETINTTQPPERRCSTSSEGSGQLCFDDTCYSCNSIREATSQTVRGTLLIPCRTAMRGSFPLNGTYFQVNEVFADHESSLNPIDVPRDWLWNLRRRTVYFGTSIPTIFKGLEPYEIQYCFWRGFVCVRGFDRATRGPRPLIARLHFPVSHANKMAKNKGGGTAESSVAKDASDETPAGKQAVA